MDARILIVEDDPKIAELVTKNLSAAGFDCLHAGDGPSGYSEIERSEPDLLILDVMLPGLDGLEITRRVRRTSKLPILLLTARGSEGDKVLGFELGADDYLTKPFSIQELLARVRALLRRSSYQSEPGALEIGALSIDPSQRQVSVAGELVELTSLEFDALYMMATHPGRVYSRESLMNQVWGEDRIVDARSIDSLISRLRKKLEPTEKAPRYIETVWGAGYRFRKQAS